MTSPPNMASITASLEESLLNCSLNHHHDSTNNSNSGGGASGGGDGGRGGGISIRSNSDLEDSTNQIQQYEDDVSNVNTSSEEAALELNSDASLHQDWEQCLDLKSGEVYYMNGKTGMKVKEDPRSTTVEDHGCYSDDEDDDDDSSHYYYSEESSTESSSPLSPSASKEKCKKFENITIDIHSKESNERENVLVVAGCRRCFMYYMVAKHLQLCPKCSAQLLHFSP